MHPLVRGWRTGRVRQPRNHCPPHRDARHPSQSRSQRSREAIMRHSALSDFRPQGELDQGYSIRLACSGPQRFRGPRGGGGGGKGF